MLKLFPIKEMINRKLHVIIIKKTSQTYEKNTTLNIRNCYINRF